MLTKTIKILDPTWTLGAKCLFHVKSFLTLLSAIGNIAVWGAMTPAPWIRVTGLVTSIIYIIKGFHHSKFQNHHPLSFNVETWYLRVFQFTDFKFAKKNYLFLAVSIVTRKQWQKSDMY